MKTICALPVSKNHAVIICTKQKNQNKFGTLLSMKNMAIDILKSYKTQNSKILMKGLYNICGKKRKKKKSVAIHL
jgi:hypothetical protein